MANKSATPNYFVTQTNPEIFSVAPRPGGLAKINVPPKPNRIQENAAKLRREAHAASKMGLSVRQLRKSASQPRTKASARDVTATSPARKSLLTVTKMEVEPKELHIDECPLEYKVKHIIAASPWSVEFDEFIEPTEESKRNPDPFQDSVDMLAMSISVVMLLSRGYDQISSTQYKWVISYLDCVRDEYGQIPPNIQGILNHINQITGGNIVSYLDDVDELTNKDTAVAISDAPPEEAE